MCDGSHRPVMAAMAIRWALLSDLDCASVRLECHTGQAYSSITLPSLFQKLTNLASLTSRAFILHMTQVVLVARRTISWY